MKTLKNIINAIPIVAATMLPFELYAASIPGRVLAPATATAVATPVASPTAIATPVVEAKSNTANAQKATKEKTSKKAKKLVFPPEALTDLSILVNDEPVTVKDLNMASGQETIYIMDNNGDKKIGGLLSDYVAFFTGSEDPNKYVWSLTEHDSDYNKLRTLSFSNRQMKGSIIEALTSFPLDPQKIYALSTTLSIKRTGKDVSTSKPLVLSRNQLVKMGLHNALFDKKNYMGASKELEQVNFADVQGVYLVPSTALLSGGEKRYVFKVKPFGATEESVIPDKNMVRDVELTSTATKNPKVKKALENLLNSNLDSDSDDSEGKTANWMKSKYGSVNIGLTNLSDHITTTKSDGKVSTVQNEQSYTGRGLVVKMDGQYKFKPVIARGGLEADLMNFKDYDRTQVSGHATLDRNINSKTMLGLGIAYRNDSVDNFALGDGYVGTAHVSAIGPRLEAVNQRGSSKMTGSLELLNGNRETTVSNPAYPALAFTKTGEYHATNIGVGYQQALGHGMDYSVEGIFTPYSENGKDKSYAQAQGTFSYVKNVKKMPVEAKLSLGYGRQTGGYDSFKKSRTNIGLGVGTRF